MKNFLRGAFTLACSFPQTISNAYDHAGFLTWRALLDDRFMQIDEQALQVPLFRKAAAYYEDVRTRTQETLIDKFSAKGAAGDFHPKPDIKPGLYKLAALSLGLFSRIPTASGAAIVASMGLSYAVASYISGQQALHGADIAGTWLGMSGGKASSPRP